MLVQGIREIQGIERIRMTIEIEVIEVIVTNDARASGTFVKMGRTAANERGPNRQDETAVTGRFVSFHAGTPTKTRSSVTPVSDQQRW